MYFYEVVNALKAEYGLVIDPFIFDHFQHKVVIDHLFVERIGLRYFSALFDICYLKLALIQDLEFYRGLVKCIIQLFDLELKWHGLVYFCRLQPSYYKIGNVEL